MKKIIDFKKIDSCGIGRKINKVTIEIELQERENKKILSICGNVWNIRNTDIICSGQCLDELQPFFKNNKLFKEVYRLWKLYHLNNMHAGTRKQEKFLKKHGVENWTTNYEDICEFLNINNLLYDDGVKFGTVWHYWDIPKRDLEKIYKILGEA